MVFPRQFDLKDLDGTNGFCVEEGYEYLGNSVSDAGDINSDGFGDVIIGAPLFTEIGIGRLLQAFPPTPPYVRIRIRRFNSVKYQPINSTSPMLLK